MLREEFTAIFLGFIIKKAESWLPEESTEEDLLDIMQQRLTEHSLEIKKVLNKNNKGGNNEKVKE